METRLPAIFQQQIRQCPRIGSTREKWQSLLSPRFDVAAQIPRFDHYSIRENSVNVIANARIVVEMAATLFSNGDRLLDKGYRGIANTLMIVDNSCGVEKVFAGNSSRQGTFLLRLAENSEPNDTADQYKQPASVEEKIPKFKPTSGR